MTAAEKFMFDTCFDSTQAMQRRKQMQSAKEQEPPPPPTFTEEELAAARVEAANAGREQGLQESQQKDNHAAAQALTEISQKLDQMAEQIIATEEQRRHGAITAATEIVRSLFPRLSESHALSEIEAVIKDCLERLHEEARIVIRVADGLLDQLKERLEQLTRSCAFDGKVVLLADEDLAIGSVRVEWADGGAERDTDRNWREIDEILARYCSEVAGDPKVDPDSQEAESIEEPKDNTHDNALEAPATEAVSDVPTPMVGTDERETRELGGP